MPEPEPGPGEVVVAVERAGVCGTDAELFSGAMAYLHTGEAAYPVRIGHEWSGTVAAVGPGTAEGLAAHGILPDLVPVVSTQEGLLAELPRPAGRVLLAAAEGARRLLVDELDATFLPLYRTVELRPADPPRADLVVLASASQARAFAALGLDLPVVSIGPQTSEAANSAGLTIVGEARSHDLEGLVAAVRAALHA